MKMLAKTVGVLPFALGFGFGRQRSAYTTLLMATGLTFGSISALFGLTHGYIDQSRYTVLVTVVILSAIVPTLIAERFFRPDVNAAGVREQASLVPAAQSVRSEV